MSVIRKVELEFRLRQILKTFEDCENVGALNHEFLVFRALELVSYGVNACYFGVYPNKVLNDREKRAYERAEAIVHCLYAFDNQSEKFRKDCVDYVLKYVNLLFGKNVDGVTR